MKRKPSSLLRDCRGMTLMESICGLAILTVVLATIYGSFLVAQRVFGDGDAAEQGGQGAFAQVELGTASEQAYTLTLPLGGRDLHLDGVLQQAGSAEDGTALYAFYLGEAGGKDFVGNVRETYVHWKSLFDGMTPAERVAAGYPQNSDNSSVRNWLRENIYGGTWPTMPKDFLERNGLPDQTYYVQPFYEARTGGGDLEANTIIFAKTEQGDGWFVGLIYDHEEKVWYRKKSGGFTINNTWAMVKAEIHGGAWEALDW